MRSPTARSSTSANPMSDTPPPDPAVGWLLRSCEPAVRQLTARDLLGRDDGPGTEVLSGPVVRACSPADEATAASACIPVASGPGRTGDSGRWSNSAFRPASRGASRRSPRFWPGSSGHVRGSRSWTGLSARCASREGNALAVCGRLGLAVTPGCAASPRLSSNGTCSAPPTSTG